LKKLIPSGRREGSDEEVSRVYAEPTGTVDIADDGFPGVILWPEVKRETVIVAPLPSWLKTSVSPVPRQPFSILFSGQYWMFRPPNVRPPQKSYFQRKTPVAMSFVTTDHIPLFMEAHQRLEHSIDLACCSAIRMAISNADRYAGTIHLELILLEVTANRQRSQSLGKAETLSRPLPSFWGGNVPVASEMLNYPIPAGGALRAFNQITVVFHRDPVRIERSARIAIERFVLVPR
jgi:hypothetical protein